MENDGIMNPIAPDFHPAFGRENSGEIHMRGETGRVSRGMDFTVVCSCMKKFCWQQITCRQKERGRFMDNRYNDLNKPQREAVMHTEGPLLILAGAGSGKTRVLTYRAAYLIEEKGVSPYHILAITFTNKAAGEMRERIDEIAGFGAQEVWVSTFHSLCVRILRRYIDRIGYDNNFTIYDTEDQKTVMKEILKRLQIDSKIYKDRMFLHAISSAKDELVTPEEFTRRAGSDYGLKKQAQVYREYQQTLQKNNALDFDDLIMKCVELFRKEEEVLNYYQNRFRYIMVDEYQDTNTAQFELIRLLAQKYQNLCVVGDDDQSIYKFRGANIRNILNFEDEFPDAHVVKLEQNYRSTQNILDAANAVIRNNKGRKPKALWTDQPAGEKIAFRQFDTGYEEAQAAAEEIRSFAQEGRYRYSDSAVLYRTNAQSRLFEERFVAADIPYRIVGGVNFYSRKEIKDLLAYLKTVDNAKDDVAVRRIINIPKRGIGTTTVSRVQDFADASGIGFYEALCRADEIPGLDRSAGKIASFTRLISRLRGKSENLSAEELLNAVIEETGYVLELEAEHTEESQSRIENIDELVSKAASYDETAEEPSLHGFLEEVALVADIDSVEEGSDCVLLMTLHSAKGLEFPNVYLAGMEDGLFPSYLSITSDDPGEVEEERRLCYVGITRAKERLTLTCARERMVRGETRYSRPSRFIEEIPEELLSPQTGRADRARKAEADRPQAVPPQRKISSMAKESFRAKPYARDFSTEATREQSLSYKVGDRVSHRKFGEGEVLEITAGGRDYEVTVNFDRAGVKKMFASFAKLKKV